MGLKDGAGIDSTPNPVRSVIAVSVPAVDVDASVVIRAANSATPLA